MQSVLCCCGSTIPNPYASQLDAGIGSGSQSPLMTISSSSIILVRARVPAFSDIAIIRRPKTFWDRRSCNSPVWPQFALNNTIDLNGNRNRKLNQVGYGAYSTLFRLYILADRTAHGPRRHQTTLYDRLILSNSVLLRRTHRFFLIASTHSTYPCRDDQAELAWVAYRHGGKA